MTTTSQTRIAANSGGRSTRRGAWLSLALVAATLVCPAAASAQGCNQPATATLEQIIGACGGLIASGRLSGKGLAAAYLARGDAQHRKNNFDAAIGDYDAAIRIDPGLADAFRNRGVTYYNKGAAGRAIEDYNQAIRLAPNVVTYRLRAKAYRTAGDIDRAIQDYSTVLQLDPKDAEAFYERGFAMYQKSPAKENADAAIRDGQEAIKLKPGYVAAHGLMGVAYFRKAEYRSAIASLDRAVELNPKYDFGFHWRGEAHLELKEYDQAIADFSSALEVGTASRPGNYASRGRAYYAKGDFAAAMIDYNQALRNGPPDAVTYHNRALVRKRTGDTEGAIEDFSESIRLSPKYASALTHRGLAYEAKGEAQRARADYSMVGTLQPSQDSEKWAFDAAKARLAVLGGPVPVNQPSVNPPSVNPPAVNPVIRPPAAGSNRRLALVIGNGAYQVKPLTNPANDARAISAALKQLGFAVTDGFDLDYTNMRRVISEFMVRSASAELSVVFYAGHGIQAQGHNYLVPIDAKLESVRAANFELFDLDQIVVTLDDPSRTTVIILDACRNNPFATQTATRALDAAGGLTGYTAVSSGMLIAYATAPGRVAEDGAGDHSPYTAALLKHISTPNLEILDMLRRVRLEVVNQTGGKQIPWEQDSLIGDVYLAGGVRKSSAN